MDFLHILLFAILHGGTVQSGYAPHYSQGLMERVAHNRDMAPAACMVSSPVWSLGTQLWVYGKNTGQLLDCTVVDVSAPKDRARHIRTRRVVELSYEVTTALCGSTKKRVIDCPVVVMKLQGEGSYDRCNLSAAAGDCGDRGRRAVAHRRLE